MRCAVRFVALWSFLFVFESLNAHPVDQGTEHPVSDSEVFVIHTLVEPTKGKDSNPFHDFYRDSSIATTLMAMVPPDTRPVPVSSGQEKYTEYQSPTFFSTATGGSSFPYILLPEPANRPVCVGKNAAGVQFEFLPLDENYIIIYDSDKGRISTFDFLPANTVTINCTNTKGETRVYDMTQCPRPEKRQKRGKSNNPFCGTPQFALNELPLNEEQRNNNQDDRGNNNQANIPAGHNGANNGQGNNNRGVQGNNNRGVNNEGNEIAPIPNRHRRSLGNQSPSDSSFRKDGCS